MCEHRAILFAEDVAADFDDQVWTDSKDLAVECRMVQRAQCHAAETRDPSRDR